MLKITLTAVIAIILTGCGQPTFECSPGESSEQWGQEIAAKLSEDERERLKKAMGVLLVSVVIETAGSKEEEVSEELCALLHGKTAGEILQMASDLEEKFNQ